MSANQSKPLNQAVPRSFSSRIAKALEASREGNTAIMELLLKAGLNQNHVPLDRTSDRSEPIGNLLHAAVEFEQLHVVKLLLDYGADAEARDSWGRTALEVALEKARLHHGGLQGRIVTVLSNHLVMKILKRPDW